MTIIGSDKTPALCPSPDSSNAPPQPCLTPWHWGWSAALAAIVLITLAFRYALPVRDGDLWWHMLYGKYFLENGTLIADHTIFSWTTTTNDTIYVTWLPDIFLYLLHKAAGLPGIFAFRYLCMLVPVLGCFLYARKLRIATHPLTWILCLLTVIMSYTAAFEKPEVLSFVFMTLLAWNWWHIRSSGAEAWKNCYLFPLIMLTWVNTHGGFVFGAVFLFLIGLGELFNTWLSPKNSLSPQLRKHLIIALLLAAITPLLNPYGFHYPLQLFRDLLPTQENINYNNKIAAYARPFESDTPFHNFALYANLAIIILLFCYLNNFKKKTIEWSSLLTNFFFVILYSRFLRTTFFWPPIFMFSCLHLLSLSPDLSFLKKHRRVIHNTIAAFLLILGGGLSGDALYKSAVTPEAYQWMGFGISEANPVEEAEYIRKYFPNSRIGNTYSQGAYLLWLLWPNNLVFFDARHFPYKKLSDDFFSFQLGENVIEFTKKYPADIWCIDLSHLITCMTLYLSEDWDLLYYGKNSAIFGHRGIKASPDSPRVSPQLTEVKSLPAAIHIIAFSCAIKDWETTEKLLIALQKKFKTGIPKDRVKKASSFYNGVRAYYAGNYREAYEGLLVAYPDPFDSARFLTSCLLFLSKDAWSLHDDETALNLNVQAWNLFGKNIYSSYNAGVILWYHAKKNHLGTNHSLAVIPDWQNWLQFFIKHAKGNAIYDTQLVIAKKILNNEYNERPDLIVPPQPQIRQSTPND